MQDDFGLWELAEYINAHEMIGKIKRAKEEVIQDLYDDCDPTMTFPDYDLGVTRKVGVDVAEMAIMIIERKEGFDRMIERYEQKADLFDAALKALTDHERDVIAVRYFGKPNDMGLTLEYFHKTLQEAENKLISTICALIVNRDALKEQAVQEERHQRVQEWKVREAL